MTLPTIDVLVQRPSDTQTGVLAIGLFRSAIENRLSGSLTILDERLNGLLSLLRTPERFGGELGETMMVTPPRDLPVPLGAARLLLLGLGSREEFVVSHLRFVGKALYREAMHSGAARVHFAPAILDGGLSGIPGPTISEQATLGLLDAFETETWLASHFDANEPILRHVTFLAGAGHETDSRAGIAAAVAAFVRARATSPR